MAMREADPERKILVIDSFEGCGKRTSEDFPTDENYEGAFSADGVENYLKQFEIQEVKPPNQIVKTWIDSDSIKAVKPRDISVLFLDLDFYVPTSACIKYLKPMIVKDGVLLIHDYNMKTCPGIKRCCDEESLELTFLAGYLSEWRKDVSINVKCFT